ncbi:MAG: hypothetical protein FH751_08920 [Firmicutes bacterium]|nr:hypothetical protein [Bacillota bacterium]
MRNKIIIYFFILLIGVFLGKLAFNDKIYLEDIKIIGDVREVLSTKDILNLKEYKIKLDSTKKKAYKINDIIKLSEPVKKDFNILLVGSDGICGEISGDKLNESFLYYSKENKWEVINFNHPINGNIKKIKNIVIISQTKDYSYGVNIINQEKNIENITPGNLYKMSKKSFLHKQGETTKEIEDISYNVSQFRERKLLPIKDIIEYKRALIMNSKGNEKYINSSGYLELKGNTINYVSKGLKEKIKDIRGIIINPTSNRNMNLYYDTYHYIENDEKVLAIFLDGFGYKQYEYAALNGYIPFMSTLEIKKAMSVYKPVTNAGFAAMITGKIPKENGVLNRSYRKLKVDTIFDKVDKLGKEGILIEGDIKILDTSIEPKLNIDLNNNSTIDDEIYNLAMKEIKKNTDFLMLHFHGIDNIGHKTGHLSKETMESIKIHDEYVKNLVKNWEGKVIMTSDHGMHTVKEGGDHGQVRVEDIFVPYIIK